MNIINKLLMGSTTNRAPLPGSDPHWADTGFLLQNNNYAVLDIRDVTGKNKLESVNAQNNAITRNGGGSIFIPGSRPTISAPDKATGNVLGTIFTAETWFYRGASGSVESRLMGKFSAGKGGWLLTVRDQGIVWYHRNDGTVMLAANLGISAGYWYHVAVTGDGTNVRLFVNGYLQSTLEDSQAPQHVSTPFLVGDYDGATGIPFSGFLEDMRLTLNTCRYTGNFDLPSKAPNF